MSDDASEGKVQKLQTVRGMQDFLPIDHDYFTVLKKALRHRCRQAGLRRISTPILEDAALFQRGLGETTDAVSKEMYHFKVGKNHLALKPECTAGACRAYLEHGMGSEPQPIQWYYVEPCFRHDRPQKGRYRQFWQMGTEIIGARDASIDAQMILMAWKILQDVEISDRFTLKINTIGNAEERKTYEEALREFFLPKIRNLSPISQERVETNPLRILDSKDEDDQILSGMAPKFVDFLGEDSKNYYAEVKRYLEALEIPFEEDSKLVRGLDYYSDTVFEIVDRDGLAAISGGRYDGLIEILGGPPTPGFGWGAGVERLIMHLQEAAVVPPTKDQIDVYVACLGLNAKAHAMKLISELHDRGVHTVGATGKASMRAQLKAADKSGAIWTLLVGDVEIREGVVILRNMIEGEQKRIPLDEAIDSVINLLDPEHLDVWHLGE